MANFQFSISNFQTCGRSQQFGDAEGPGAKGETRFRGGFAPLEALAQKFRGIFAPAVRRATGRVLSKDVLPRGANKRRLLRGFTIIELLVVLAIIGLLAALTIASLTSARAKSRDARRESDIKTLQSALALYVTNAGTYPNPTAAGGVCLTGSDAISSILISAGAISAMPRDPLHTCGSGLPTASNPHYHYTSTDGTTYSVVYYLETSTIPGKSSGQQPPISP